MQNKVMGLEEKVLSYKQRLVILEQKVADYETRKDEMSVHEARQQALLEDNENRISVFTQQVAVLEKALEESENSCQELLRNKQELYYMQFSDFLKEDLKISQIQVSESLNSIIQQNSLESINKLRKSYITELNLEKEFCRQNSLLKEGQ